MEYKDTHPNNVQCPECGQDYLRSTTFWNDVEEFGVRDSYFRVDVVYCAVCKYIEESDVSID